MKNAFGENWDGIRRNKNLNEAKDPTKQQIAAVRKSSKPSADKQSMVAKIMNMREEEEDFVEDGEAESTKPVLSSQGKQKNLNRMNAFVKKVEAKSKAKKEEAETEAPVISESSMQHWTQLDKAANDIVKIVKSMPKQKVGYSPVQAQLLQVANSLYLQDKQVQYFMDGLVMSLEGIFKKTSSPSKHGNMEILNDISKVIRELKNGYTKSK